MCIRDSIPVPEAVAEHQRWGWMTQMYSVRSRESWGDVYKRQDLMNEGGLNKARWSCSDTAQYGDYVNTVINEDCRKRMEYHLQRIQDLSLIHISTSRCSTS